MPPKAPTTPGNNQAYNYFEADPYADNAFKSSVPFGFTGQGIIWFTTTAPAGWLICDGSLVDKLKYPDLWLLLGNTWGTSTSTQFYLPDLRQRVPVGKHSSGTFNALNNTGGAETVTLTAAQSGLPAHTHQVKKGGTAGGDGSGLAWSSTATTNSAHDSGVTGGAQNASAAHTNLQPYNVVNFIIKT
jgi:microcystin-dependent protein